MMSTGMNLPVLVPLNACAFNSLAVPRRWMRSLHSSAHRNRRVLLLLLWWLLAIKEISQHKPTALNVATCSDRRLLLGAVPSSQTQYNNENNMLIWLVARRCSRPYYYNFGGITLLIAVTAIHILVAVVVVADSTVVHYDGTRPNLYRVNEKVKLWMSSLYSADTTLPVDEWRLPFCPPAELQRWNYKQHGYHTDYKGYRQDYLFLDSSPYQIEMKVDKYCETLCVSNVGRGEKKGIKPNKLVLSIHKHYEHVWILDGLVVEQGRAGNQNDYFQKFPIGFTRNEFEGGLSYVNNHVTIDISYQRHNSTRAGGKNDDKQLFEILDFTVTPSSRDYNYDEASSSSNNNNNTTYCGLGSAAETLPTTAQVHDDLNLGFQPQLASGRVLFTYDVIWNEKLPQKTFSNTATTSYSFVAMSIITVVISLLVLSLWKATKKNSMKKLLPHRYGPIGQNDKEEHYDGTGEGLSMMNISQ